MERGKRVYRGFLWTTRESLGEVFSWAIRVTVWIGRAAVLWRRQQSATRWLRHVAVLSWAESDRGEDGQSQCLPHHQLPARFQPDTWHSTHLTGSHRIHLTHGSQCDLNLLQDVLGETFFGTMAQRGRSPSTGHILWWETILSTKASQSARRS